MASRWWGNVVNKIDKKNLALVELMLWWEWGCDTKCAVCPTPEADSVCLPIAWVTRLAGSATVSFGKTAVVSSPEIMHNGNQHWLCTGCQVLCIILGGVITPMLWVKKRRHSKLNSIPNVTQLQCPFDSKDVLRNAAHYRLHPSLKGTAQPWRNASLHTYAGSKAKQRGWHETSLRIIQSPI